MARTVEDVALLLSAMAGPDPRSPIAIDEPGARFRGPLGRSFAGVRVAWSRDLGGLPIDPRVTAVIDAQRATFQALGCAVEDGQPDFSDAREIFQWRGWRFRRALCAAARRHRHQLKDTII
jgi:amidase